MPNDDKTLIENDRTFFELLTQTPHSPSLAPLVNETKTPSTQENKSEREHNAEPQDNLPLSARRLWIYLLHYGSLLQSQQPKLFAELKPYVSLIRQQLHYLGLSLIFDERFGVALVRPEPDSLNEEENMPTLIPRRPLQLLDSLILLKLRSYYQERESLGEYKVMIDVERFYADLTPLMPESGRDSLDKQRLKKRLEKFAEYKILIKPDKDEERYEITPIIRYVVDSSMLQALLQEYKKLAETTQNEDLSMTEAEGEE